MLSACTGDHVMLELLLDANADPNAQDMVRVGMATSNCQDIIIQTFLLHKNCFQC